MRITRLELEGFRAYKEAIAFDCAADAVIVVGPNGYGKTSFFDAVSWALFGHIRRLTGSRDAVGDEYVGNRFAASKDIVVRLFMEHEGSSALVSRTRDTFAVVVDGNELEHRAASRWVATLFSRSMGLRHMPTISEAERIYERCFLLSQEELTAFVRETSPRERFDIVARLLGVDIVRNFYTHEGNHLEELEGRAADIASELRILDQRLERVRLERTRIEAAGQEQPRPSLARLRGQFKSILQSNESDLGSVTPRPVSRMSASDILEAAELAVTQVVGSVDDLSREVEALSELVDLQPSYARLRARARHLRDQVSGLESQSEQAQQRLERARTRASDLQAEAKGLHTRESEIQGQNEEWVDFLTSAREHVVSDRCPVCGQAIVPGRVLSRLQQQIDQIPKELREISEARRSVTSRIARHRTALAKREEEADRLRQESIRHQTELNSLDRQLREFEELAAVAGLDVSVLETPSPVKNALTQAKRNQTRLRALQRQLAGLLAQAEYLTARAALTDLRREQRDLTQQRMQLVERSRQVGTLQRLLQQVIRASKRSEVDLVREILSRQQPLINALYRRLNPHPVLDRLDVDFKLFADKGELYFYAASEAVRGNVNTIFSSAQLNAVATCIFLSLNLSHSGTAPAMALLDDPIQNMDDYNVVGLLDMLRAFLPVRQLILSTHDATIGQLIARKLRPVESGRRTIVHNFVGYEADGPRVRTDVMEHQPEPWVIERLAG